MAVGVSRASQFEYLFSGFFALIAGIGDNAAHPCGQAILLLQRKGDRLRF